MEFKINLLFVLVVVSSVPCVNLKPLRPVLVVELLRGVLLLIKMRRPDTTDQSSSRLRAKIYRRKPPDAEISLESWREINILSLHVAPIHISEARIPTKAKFVGEFVAISSSR